MQPGKLPESWRSCLNVLVASALLGIAATPPAHAAYVDPGSGALLLQAIGAGILGIVFFFRQSFARLFRWTRRDHPADAAEPPAGETPAAK
ncbi:MAG: hypothetical protein K0Q72_2687 [Armatimonadetes bacterium]|nr:hypothetical protein [Armatimonadota bacterium]